jgi:molybdate transport system substrate-binding protein
MQLPSRIALLLLTLLAAPALAEEKPPAPKPNLTIIADSSLILPLSELTRIYTKRTSTPLTIIRNDGGDPARQLEQGFEAHILLSSDPTLIEKLAQRGLIDVFGTQPFARTQLALVAPYRIKSKLNIAKRISFAAVLLAQADLPVYVTNPTTQEGLRAQALMTTESDFSSELSARAVVQPDHEAVMDALRHADGLALMLAAEAVTEPDITIVSLLPEATSEPVRFDALVLASESMEQARDFTHFLTSDEAQAVLARYGFQPPESTTH